MKKAEEIIGQGMLTVPFNNKSSEANELQSILDKKIDSYSTEQQQAITLFSFRVKMKDYLAKPITTKEIKLAGDFLKDLLRELNIKQNRFASYLAMQPSNLSKILNGDRKISFEFALILEQLFNIESDIWLSIQSKNKLLALPISEVKRVKKYKLKDLV